MGSLTDENKYEVIVETIQIFNQCLVDYKLLKYITRGNGALISKYLLSINKIVCRFKCSFYINDNHALYSNFYLQELILLAHKILFNFLEQIWIISHRNFN